MEDSRVYCDICSEPINIRVLQHCGHNDICLQCYIRYSKNYGNNCCYYCQQNNDGSWPIATSKLNLDYESAKQLNLEFDDANKIYYTDPAAKKEIKNLNMFNCHHCHHKFHNINQFSKHLEKHGETICRICQGSGRFNPHSLETFTKAEIHKHIHQHHPRCICCKSLFFDQHTLAEHMNESHQRCEICAKNNKIIWFNTPQDLIEHNEKEHFVCHHQDCAAMQLVAFATRGELLLHLQRVHHDFDNEIDFMRDFEVEETTTNTKSNNYRSEFINIYKKKVWEILKAKPKVEKYSSAFNSFIKNRISCAEFYKLFSEFFGESKNMIFCDMIATLRDSTKRMELFRIHNGIKDEPLPSHKLIIDEPIEEEKPSIKKVTVKHNDSPRRKKVVRVISSF
ncbi:Zinc finger, C2H2 type family protein [Trichomonas vaginalis G3]|uniref:Zinc finger, C2H2 type family protein n=1 Tax=Trichomonas vaginalis (strain ATCC PRA-98 / G3) TaxID=412133 RepID=A2ELQ7_TRIV3|nr:rescue of stalled ribosome [Trichomonas vaginalis G3]EAY06422.1 Zinc finger, C2H2 type family protein [Trichomonas vaginalis G3]KAI5503010.1 rescue of stalled ribosome [Trichomonas vaginalis G3]|eukprot:XP_001318645.1 Zinc finger, C2H2 type family protein [Trichomonas vaginalis G3]